MDYQNVDFSTDGAVAKVTLHRPAELNAFNAPLREELLNALQSAGDDPAIRAIVLGAEGKLFSSGADLNEAPTPGQSVEELILTEYAPILQCLREVPKPVVAAVPGGAVGVAAAMVMACDLVVMADSGFMVVAYSNIGLVPDGGLSWQLLRYLGYQQAFQLIAEGGRLSAAECADAGIANKVVAKDDVAEAAQRWAQSLAERAPIALAQSKQLLRQAEASTYMDTVRQEAGVQNVCIASEDSKEAIRAFMEKRQAVFNGR